MFERELAVALEAARLAGDYLLREYEAFARMESAPADISTHADKGSQEIILKHLHQAFPNDALCAEEATESLRNVACVGRRTWIVDPIDGTRGFVVKNGEFSIMIGFVEAGQIGVGVVYQPVAERLTYANLGGGCWRQDGSATPVQCRVTPVTVLEHATLTQSRSRTPGKRSKWAEALRPAKIVESYSAGIKLALVARGDADVYLNTYEAFHDWDICAGHLLVHEAGGKVSGTGGQVLVYGSEGAWQRDGLLATNGSLHELAVKIIQENS